LLEDGESLTQIWGIWISPQWRSVGSGGGGHPENSTRGAQLLYQLHFAV